MEESIKEKTLYSVAYLTEAMIEMNDLFYDDEFGGKAKDIEDKIQEIRKELIGLVPAPKKLTKEEKIKALQNIIEGSHEIEEVKMARKELRKIKEGMDTFFDDEETVKSEFYSQLIEQYLIKSRKRKVGLFVPPHCIERCPLLKEEM